MEFREPIQPFMNFGSAYDVQLGIPTIREQHYDPALGFNPFPPYQLTPEEQLRRKVAFQQMLDKFRTAKGGF